jgi:acyl-CoA thioesterase-1
MDNYILKKYNVRDIIVFLLAIVILVLILSAGRHYDKSYFKGRLVVAFGDSLTSGVGAPSVSESYVAHLAASSGTTIINKGVGGNTTTKALARVQTDVLDLNPKPEVAIVLLGGNDFFKGTPQKTTKEDLTKIVDLIQGAGIKVILLGISRLHFPDYENMIQAIAMKKGASYVPSILDGIADNEGLMSDLKHPNSDGYKLMAQRIEPTLERVLLGY